MTPIVKFLMKVKVYPNKPVMTKFKKRRRLIKLTETANICLREVGGEEVEREAQMLVELASLADCVDSWLGGNAGQTLIGPKMFNLFAASTDYSLGPRHGIRGSQVLVRLNFS